MWRRTRYILAAILVAYLIGAAPVIIDYINNNIIFSSSNVITLRPEIAHYISATLDKIRSYSGYFIIIYASVIAALIFLENNNPDRTLLWLAVLIFVPFLGLFIYLLVGPDIDNLRRRHNFRPKEFVSVPEEYKQDMRIQTAQMLHELVGAELTYNNGIKILINGEEAFPAMLDAISKAKVFIHLQSFIIKDDETGRMFRDALVKAAERGVKIRVLYDAIGSRRITKAFVQSLLDKGIKCISFLPVSFPMFRRRMNFRNHRKVCVVDGVVAFTGGLNLSNNYIHKGNMGFWRDTHVQVMGDCVRDLHNIFLADWQDRTDETPESVKKTDNVTYPKMTTETNLAIQVVPSGVSSPWHSIEMGFISMIARAKQRVWITTPYLVPGPLVMSALRMAAMSGVDVRVLIPKKGDSFLVYWGSCSNYEELLSTGVKIYRYTKGFIHTKTLLADNDMCSVGSCNLDVRSLEINFEDQLFIYDRQTTEQFAQQFEKDLEDAEELTITEWSKRSFGNRLIESFGKLYSAQI